MTARSTKATPSLFAFRPPLMEHAAVTLPKPPRKSSASRSAVRVPISCFPCVCCVCGRFVWSVTCHIIWTETIPVSRLCHYIVVKPTTTRRERVFDHAYCPLPQRAGGEGSHSAGRWDTTAGPLPRDPTGRPHGTIPSTPGAPLPSVMPDHLPARACVRLRALPTPAEGGWEGVPQRRARGRHLRTSAAGSDRSAIRHDTQHTGSAPPVGGAVVWRRPGVIPLAKRSAPRRPQASGHTALSAEDLMDVRRRSTPARGRSHADRPELWCASRARRNKRPGSARWWGGYAVGVPTSGSGEG